MLLHPLLITRNTLMKMKYIALAITAALSLNGCKVIDKIKDKIDGVIEEETNDLINDFNNDIQDTIDGVTDVVNGLAIGDLNRQTLISLEERVLITFADSTGTHYESKAGNIDVSDFSYSISNNILTLVDTNNGSIENLAITNTIEDQITLLTIDTGETETMYQPSPLSLADLEGKTLSFNNEGESDCMSTIKFSNGSAEYAEKCDSEELFTDPVGISMHPLLDNTVVFSFTEDGESVTEDVTLIRGSLMDAGTFVSIYRDSAGNATEFSVEGFTNIPCHLPEEWHAEMNHCMVMSM